MSRPAQNCWAVRLKSARPFQPPEPRPLLRRQKLRRARGPAAVERNDLYQLDVALRQRALMAGGSLHMQRVRWREALSSILRPIVPRDRRFGWRAAVPRWTRLGISICFQLTEHSRRRWTRMVFQAVRISAIHSSKSRMQARASASWTTHHGERGGRVECRPGFGLRRRVAAAGHDGLHQYRSPISWSARERMGISMWSIETPWESSTQAAMGIIRHSTALCPAASGRRRPIQWLGLLR